MASVFAIISKAVFEKQRGALGDVLPMDRYASTHKSLDGLAEGGAIVLVTVRPPDEALWLVAIVENPERDDDGWAGAANTTPITDVSALKSKLVFSTGAGITAKLGALGMSLQTPRTLTDADVALLRAAAGGRVPKAVAKPAVAKQSMAKQSVAKQSMAKQAAVAPAVGPAAVASALAAKDTEAALRAALGWWRATRDPAIADLVDAISGRVTGHMVTDALKWSKFARTRDPIVLGPLLAGVTSMTGSFLPTAAALLAAFEPDPRIATALGRWILDPPTTSSSTYPFWTKVLDVAVELGDVRLLAALKRRLAMPNGTGSQFWTKFYAALARVQAKLAALPVPASAATAKLVAAAAKLPPVGNLRASGIVAAAAPRSEAPALTGPLLAQASTHLAAGRVLAAIEMMAVHWRDTRAPEIADLIERANRLLPTWDRPLAATPKAMHAAWEQAFADPGARLPQLLENLTIGSPKELELRLVDLANLRDDSRISMRLAQLAHGCGVSPERTQFWRSLFELLARHRDIRTIAPLLREFNGFTGRYYDHHRQGLRIFGPVAVKTERAELAAADGKLAAKIDAQLGTLELAARKRERALLGAIAESPGDAGPVSVYADWLIEQGHARGELLHLDLIAKPTPAEAARRAELAQTPHVFGPIDDLASVAGMPMALSTHYAAGMLLWRELAAHPLLLAVDSIAFTTTYETELQPLAPDLAQVLNAAPHLKKVTNVRAELADEVARLTKLKRRGDDLVR